MNEPILVPYFRIYSDRIVRYCVNEGNRKKRAISDESLKNLKKEKLKGKLSYARKVKNRKILTGWIESVMQEITDCKVSFIRYEYMPVFVTLTLSDNQVHDDNWIKRNMLNQFIINIQRNHKVQHYFWRAEAQKNGRIHFHLIIDRYIPSSEVRRIWNRIQDNNGYIENFRKKHGHGQPNSTDIKGIRDVGNFVEYVIKYANKDEKYRPVQGRLTGMSDRLREADSHVAVITREVESAIEREVARGGLTHYAKEHVAIHQFNNDKLSGYFKAILNREKEKYYRDEFHWLYHGIVPDERKLVSAQARYEVEDEIMIRSSAKQLELFPVGKSETA